MNIKSLLASAAALAFVGGAAIAQEDPATTEQTTPMLTEDAGAGQYAGKPVYNTSGEQVGTVDEVITGDDGAQHAVISVGTFLGLGAKRILVPLAELTTSADGAGFTLTLTADEIEAAPDYEKPE